MKPLLKRLALIFCLSVSLNLSAQTTMEETAEDLEFFHLVNEMPYFGECTLPNKNEETDCFKKAFATFLKSNLVYPKVAAPLKEQVKVYVKFVVTEEGNVIGKELVKSSGLAIYDQEALNVIAKLPTFTPGKEKGVPVKVLYLVAVDFNP
jgi:protein TonB